MLSNGATYAVLNFLVAILKKEVKKKLEKLMLIMHIILLSISKILSFQYVRKKSTKNHFPLIFSSTLIKLVYFFRRIDLTLKLKHVNFKTTSVQVKQMHLFVST